MHKLHKSTKFSLRILVFALGDSTKASSRVRAFWLADELMERNHLVSVIWNIGPTNWVKMIFEIFRCDAVIFQKTYSRYHLLIAKWLRKLNKPIFVDIDDFPSRNHNTITLTNFKSLCNLSRAVFAGSNALKNWISEYHPHVYLVPSSIKTAKYKAIEKSGNANKICLGWIGNGKHYQTDLMEIILPILSYFNNEPLVEFRFIGVDSHSEFAQKARESNPESVVFVQPSNWSDSKSIVSELNKLDIGLYPLIENDFNKFKCGFKALEYFALKIPVVSSDIAMNREIIEHNVNGFFANNTHEWIEKLTLLIQDKSLRYQFGLAGYSLVQEKYTIAITANKILEIIRENE